MAKRVRERYPADGKLHHRMKELSEESAREHQANWFLGASSP